MREIHHEGHELSIMDDTAVRSDPVSDLLWYTNAITSEASFIP